MADLSILNGLAQVPNSAPSAGGGTTGKTGTASAPPSGKGFSGYLQDSLCFLPQPQANRMGQRQFLSGSAERHSDCMQNRERVEAGRLALRDSRATERSSQRSRIQRDHDQAGNGLATKDKSEPVIADGAKASASKAESKPKESVKAEVAPVERQVAENAAESEVAVDAVNAPVIPVVAPVPQENRSEEASLPLVTVTELPSQETELKDNPPTPSLLAMNAPERPVAGDVEGEPQGQGATKAFSGLALTEMPEKTAQSQGQTAAPLMPDTVVTEAKTPASETKTSSALLTVQPNQLALLAGLRKETADPAVSQGVTTTTDPLPAGEPALVETSTASPVATTAQGKGENPAGWMTGGQNPGPFAQTATKGGATNEEAPFRLHEAQGVGNRMASNSEAFSTSAKPAISREAAAAMRSDVFRQIVVNSELLKKADTSELRIQLKPEFLGKLNLNLSVENGIVSVRFAAENPQVRQMLESNLNQLKQSLEEQGLRFDRVEVGVSQQGADSRHGAGDSRQSSPERWGSDKGTQTGEGATVTGNAAADSFATRAYYREDTTVEFLA
ncbi:hypothetical protein GTO91_12515 [Heliobacterium undosum]|uniref:Flagellar hook-length control protein-like C-terminal domain-containing protein n=1 Tax=Heliomicrobium undosum TaxID=121734 RepID=A0A845L1X5_9FIRM|nr:flagellar hook-length control protein FliK [Heliomicrobium undosum]MZP30537.1 hypothetical protein [Heliomicrobium undosum]